MIYCIYSCKTGILSSQYVLMCSRYYTAVYLWQSARLVRVHIKY